MSPSQQLDKIIDASVQASTDPNERRGHLFYSDNLNILKKYPSESIDLIYLDPPFQSNKDYNMMFRDAFGRPIPEQIKAYTDTWNMDESKWNFVYRTQDGLRYNDDEQLRANYGPFLNFFHSWSDAVGALDGKMRAYLIYMARRLIEMHRILKPTGSLYLHCDQYASHYLKVLMDGIFGKNNFRNEIVWCYTQGGRPKKDFPNKHETIFRYSKSNDYHFFPERINIERESFSEKTGSPFHRVDEHGRKFYIKHVNGKEYKYYEDEGKTPYDWWIDIYKMTGRYSKKVEGEYLGYETQKPIALLKRIIAASCPENGIVMDPFCGCGTTTYASQHLRRQWIGIDIGILGVRLIKRVLEGKIEVDKSKKNGDKNLYFKSVFYNLDIKDKALKDKPSLKENRDFVISGIPITTEQAKDFWHRDKFEFERWIVLECLGIPTKKPGDKGIDGVLDFYEGTRNLKDPKTMEIKKDAVKRMLLSVKGGKLKANDVRDLIGTVQKEQAEMGGLICFDEPSVQMKEEMAKMGSYTNKETGLRYDKIQYRTLRQILRNNLLFNVPNRPSKRDYIKVSQLRMDDS